jgi:DeoR/GlpR family transcriptional regulator of sugar metabolism
VLAVERRQAIVELIHDRSQVHVQELCTRFDASAATIRRDLTALEQQGLLKRTYGGAVRALLSPTHRLTPTALSDRADRIGAAAAALIAGGETVFLSSGASALAVAHHIAHRPDITVVTHSLAVASFLTDQSDLPVILTGGQVDRQESTLVGLLAELMLDELRADRAIISVGGIHVPDGVTGQNLSAVGFLRTVIGLAQQTVVLAESGRWGHVGPAFLAPLEAIDTIVTDRDAPPAMIWDLAELGIEIVQG